MNIVVCIKQTTDTAATLSVVDGEASYGDAALVLNPWDEYAVEQALLTKEAEGGKVTALCLGPDSAEDALKQALAMGCDEAVLILDAVFESADTLVVSRALAAGIKKLDPPELVFFGKSAVDSDTGVMGPQVARRLGWPSLNLVAAIPELDASAKTITVERLLEEGRQIVSGRLPAVVSVVKEINEPRYPSFMGIRKASKAEIPRWSAADVGLAGQIQPALSWPEILAPEKTEAVCELIEGGDASEIARKLVDRLVEEKVI
ncbi:MAG: electron transfer flavoprotein subunit beta/FixA family protein [Chloroflexi bacterium]|nr:electron transfer flavoprotein subunit beta/FixA family protein [Chloroflexota bacterium]